MHGSFNIKRILWILTAVSFALSLFYQFPLFIPVLLLLLIAGISYYTEVIKPYKKKKSKTYTLLVFFLFFPWILTLLMLISLPFKHPAYWDDRLRIYWIAAIIIFFSAQIFPFLFHYTQGLIAHFSRQNTENQAIARREFLKQSAWLLGGISTGIFTAGVFVWNHRFRLHEKHLSFPHLPPHFDGLKILQISDLHLGNWDSLSAMHKLVELINRQEADIIVFTGDLVDFITSEAFRFKRELQKIKAKEAVYCILGNHDYGDYMHWDTAMEKEKNFEALLQFYRELNWQLLRNESIVLERGKDRILLSGVENWGDRKRYQKLADLDKTYLGYENISFKILLSHNPAHWEKHILHFKHTIDLTLSGHTHGGQIGVEWNGIRWSPIAYLYPYWAGLYRETNTQTGQQQLLYVNRGTGSIGYPGRIGILPEVTVFKLHKGKKENGIDA